ncbi:MAG: hypothetical protein H6629_08345 [Calditrichae bacterium]|nr:hypothetical protein [Calditrichia bacterium]
MRINRNKMMNHWLVLWIAAAIFAGCAGSSRFVVPEPPPDDQKVVPVPHSREINLAADNVSKIGTMQIKNLFDISRHGRAIFNKPKEAMNVDAFDEVYNSSWFTNRNGLAQMNIADFSRGPDQSSGPDTGNVWTIVAAKTQGVTPGFNIRDSRDQQYVIKFDPAGYPELATGAEVVSTKLFHAAGFNVPENYLVKFDPAILRIGNEVKFTDKQGQKRFMNEDDLAKILAKIQKLPNGRIRAVASKYLPGKPMGAFFYTGIRKDDLNDVIPHQHRRELRGLRWIAGWLNHFDTKANNSLDMYDPAGYVKHYLIDFGSTLGSQGNEPMPPEIGREGIVDPPQVAKVIGTLGIYKRPWERDIEIKYPSIGYFVSADFRPEKYKYIMPNPAFGNATNRDSYWGAKIVMSFTDEQIRSAVAQGQYSNPEAAEYLAKIIIERRDIVGKYWFDRMAPLDRFALQQNSDGAQMLHFDDLAIDTRLADATNTRYQITVERDAEIVAAAKDIGNRTAFSLADLRETAANFPDSQWAIIIELTRGEKNWPQPVTVFLKWDNSQNTFHLIGLQR